MTRAAREVLPDPDDPQAAVVAIDIPTGDVKAMTTLRRVPPVTLSDGTVSAPVDGYQRDDFNLAVAGRRSTGSTIKPFTLAVALEKGLSLDTRRAAPSCNRIPDRSEDDGLYEPCNAAGEGAGGLGRITLRRALQGSVNTVFVPLAIEVGRERIKDVMLASGVVAKEEAFFTNVNSFGLGATALVSPLSMANAYGTLMNGGLHMAPRYVRETRTADGGLVERAPDAPEPAGRALEEGIARKVVEAMSGVTKPGGTARAAAQAFPVFGKTGTTNDSTDAWFIGCAQAPQNTCIAVWMGYEYQNCNGVQRRDCGGMKGVNGVEQVYGGTLPAKIFDRTWEIYDEIMASRAATAAGEPLPETAPSAAEVEPSPERSRTPRPRRSTAPAPVQEPVTPETEAPPTQEPTQDPEPEPEPSESDPPLLPPPGDPDPSPGQEAPG